MTVPVPNEDGALQPALYALEVAIDKLTGPTYEYLDGELLTTPSLYMQLRDAVAGEQVNTGSGGGSKSRPPIWVDAFDILDEIDTALEIWQPAYSGVPASVGRLHWLLQRKWRPQDVRQIDQLTEHVLSWVKRIQMKLNPPRVLTLTAACPACGVETVYRRDDCGERVRQPALQIGKDGCQCQSCRYVWEPYRYQILAAALGFPLPTGVLE